MPYRNSNGKRSASPVTPPSLSNKSASFQSSLRSFLVQNQTLRVGGSSQNVVSFYNTVSPDLYRFIKQRGLQRLAVSCDDFDVVRDESPRSCIVRLTNNDPAYASNNSNDNNSNDTDTSLQQEAILFHCNHATYDECITKRLFGSSSLTPSCSKVASGTPLFLFNISTRTIHGPFLALSAVTQGIDASAFSGRFQYQVKVTTLRPSTTPTFHTKQQVEQAIGRISKSNVITLSQTVSILRLFDKSIGKPSPLLTPGATGTNHARRKGLRSEIKVIAQQFYKIALFSDAPLRQACESRSTFTATYKDWLITSNNQIKPQPSAILFSLKQQRYVNLSQNNDIITFLRSSTSHRRPDSLSTSQLIQETIRRVQESQAELKKDRDGYSVDEITINNISNIKPNETVSEDVIVANETNTSCTFSVHELRYPPSGIKFPSGSVIIPPNSQHIVGLNFTPLFHGITRAVLKFQFNDTCITRRLTLRCANVDDEAFLKPTSPYVRPSRKSKGVDPFMNPELVIMPATGRAPFVYPVLKTTESSAVWTTREVTWPCTMQQTDRTSKVRGATRVGKPGKQRSTKRS